MKKLKLASFALLMVVMLLAILPVSVYADNTETNLTYTLSHTEVKVGDTFTLKIGNKDMNVSSIFFGVYFDNNVLEVTKRTSKPKLEYEYYDEEIYSKPYFDEEDLHDLVGFKPDFPY
jgi:hypothetical protein